MISNVFNHSEHPIILFLLVLAIVLTASGIIAELAHQELIAGFLGVFAVLLFVFWALSFSFMAVLKRIAS